MRSLDKKFEILKKIEIRGNILENKRECRYCHETLSRKTATLEHKKAKSKGGSNRIENLDISCLECNRTKGSMSDGEYMKIIKNINVSNIYFIRAYIRRRINLATHRVCKKISNLVL